jgi:hypothetical protein
MTTPYEKAASAAETDGNRHRASDAIFSETYPYILTRCFSVQYYANWHLKLTGLFCLPLSVVVRHGPDINGTGAQMDSSCLYRGSLRD